MARNRTVVDVPIDTVFGILSDPPTYDDFVVGTKRVRHFEPAWPAVGSAFHHTVGVGPLVLRDLTVVEHVDEGRRLVLRAHMRPLAINRVDFSLRPTGTGTEIRVEEHAIEGPMVKIWNPLFDGLMWLRNQEMLRRLKRVAQRRERRSHPAKPVTS